MEFEPSEGGPRASTRCARCGAELTPEEQHAAMETGGPPLCLVHAEDLVETEAEPDDPAA